MDYFLCQLGFVKGWKRILLSWLAWNKRMIWKWLGALLLFPVQMVYLMVKAAVCMVLPPKLRDLSGENVLVTGGGRGIGRHLAREFAKRGARKVSMGVRGAPTCCSALPRSPPLRC